jgi:hypothetical protein
MISSRETGRAHAPLTHLTRRPREPAAPRRGIDGECDGDAGSEIKGLQPTRVARLRRRERHAVLIVGCVLVLLAQVAERIERVEALLLCELGVGGGNELDSHR